MICKAVSDFPSRAVSCDTNGDTVISVDTEGDIDESNGPVQIEDIPDDLSVNSLGIKPLSLNEVSTTVDSLPNIEEDMDEVVSSEDTLLVDINNVDLDED